MTDEILDLIDRYWKFDNDQTPVSNWHDKQDCLEAVRKALQIHDFVGRREKFSIPHKFSETENFIGQCSICGKGKLHH